MTAHTKTQLNKGISNPEAVARVFDLQITQARLQIVRYKADIARLALGGSMLPNAYSDLANTVAMLTAYQVICSDLGILGYLEVTPADVLKQSETTKEQGNAN